MAVPAHDPGNLAAHPQPYTTAEVLSWPDDNTSHELIDGTLFVSPHAAVRHQRALERLRDVLRPWLPAGHEMLGPVNLRVSETTLMEPDLVVLNRVDMDAIAVDPADVQLVVEVVSPSSRRIDRLIKPAIYAEAGIGAYWRIELDDPAGPVVHIYTLALDGNFYRPGGVGRAGEMLVVREPFQAEFDPAVLAGPLRAKEQDGEERAEHHQERD